MDEVIPRILFYRFDVLLGKFFRRDVQYRSVWVFVLDFHPIGGEDPPSTPGEAQLLGRELTETIQGVEEHLVRSNMDTTIVREHINDRSWLNAESCLSLRAPLRGSPGAPGGAFRGPLGTRAHRGLGRRQRDAVMTIRIQNQGTLMNLWGVSWSQQP